LRALSRAEGIVVQELLAGPSASRRSPSSASLPRRTEQTVRQRVIARDWVVPRYVPDPAALGLPIVSFVLAHPFTERARDLSDLWAATPACVFVWESSERMFGVFLAPSTAEAKRVVETALPDRLVHSHSALETDTRSGAVPVYFDFEAIWSKYAGLGGTRSYPHSLPAELADAGGPRDPDLTAGERAAMGRLLHRPFQGTSASTRGGLGLLDGARERRCLAAGWIEPRYFLDPVAVHRWAAGFPDAVAFVQGDLRPGSKPSELFREVVELCRIGPFLFATANGRVLLGTFARLKPSATTPPARPVLATLRRHLANIRVDRIPLGSIQTPKQQLFVDLAPEPEGSRASG
jgi:hypothetical protein